MKTAQNAIGNWHSILTSFGVNPEFLTGRHGPCPICGGKDKWRWDNKDGCGTYYCNAHGAGDGFQLAQDFTGKNFKDVAREIDSMLMTPDAPRPQKTDPAVRLKAISAGLIPVVAGDPVARYLLGRGISSPTSYLRHHRAMHYYDETGVLRGTYPAMVAAMQNVTGRLESMHITYLSASGPRQTFSGAKKMMPPRTGLAGTLIRLSAPLEHLGLAEGIETALAATAITGVPCWASGTAGLMESAEFPPEVQQVTIFGDNDKSYAGHKAAYVLAHKLVLRGIAVDVRFPSAVGHDFADEVAAK
jgi:putative DNA primase/helicase